MPVGSRDDQGIVLISVIITTAILTFVLTGLLTAIGDDLLHLRARKDYLRARYAADAGAAVALSFLAQGGPAAIGPLRTFDVGGARVTVRRTGARAEFIELQSEGRAGRGAVTMQVVILRDAPTRIYMWRERP